MVHPVCTVMDKSRVLVATRDSLLTAACTPQRVVGGAISSTHTMRLRVSVLLQSRGMMAWHHTMANRGDTQYAIIWRIELWDANGRRWIW